MKHIRKFDFRYRFNNVRKNYPEIFPLSNQDIITVQQHYEKNQTRFNAIRYIFIALAATLFLSLCPITITKVYDSSIQLKPFILSVKHTQEETKNVYGVTIGLISLCFLSYYLIFPALSKFLSLGSDIFSHINLKNIYHLKYCLLFIYISIALALLDFYIFNNSKVSSIIGKYYHFAIFIPAIIITLILLFYISSLTILLPFKSFFDKRTEHPIGKRIAICLNLIYILRLLYRYDNILFIPSESLTSIYSRINQTTKLIINYYENISDINENKMQADYLNAGLEFHNIFMGLFTDVKFDINLIKNKLIEYLNIFLSGDISSLPKLDSPVSVSSIKKAKYFHYALFAVYLGLPIIIIISMQLIFKISIDEYCKSLIHVLYLIWVLIGIFSNPFLLTDESKSMLKDVIGTFTGKN